MGEACLMSVSVFAVGCFALSSGNVYACIVSVQERNEWASLRGSGSAKAGMYGA